MLYEVITKSPRELADLIESWLGRVIQEIHRTYDFARRDRRVLVQEIVDPLAVRSVDPAKAGTPDHGPGPHEHASRRDIRTTRDVPST